MGNSNEKGDGYNKELIKHMIKKSDNFGKGLSINDPSGTRTIL